MKPINKPVQRACDLAPDNDFLHVGIWAETGAGKTFLMNEVHKDCEGPSILIAQPKDDDDYELYGEKVSSMADLKNKLEAGKKIHFNPPTNGKDFLKELNAIYKVARKVSDMVRIFIDEVHRVAFATADDELMAFGDIGTDARGHGVRFTMASQSLNRFSNKTGRVIVANCQMHIFLQIDDMAKGFYNYYSFPWKKMKKAINDVDYAGVRYSGGDEFSKPFKLKA